MNQLTKLSIYRPLLILMCVLGVVVMGIRSFFTLPVERTPKIDFPIVSVVVIYSGASPSDIEDLVIKPIEDSVVGISGIDKVTSTAREGVGSIVVQFLQGVNGNQAAIDVQRQVAAVRSQLPNDAQEPMVIKADINAMSIIDLTMSGPLNDAQLYTLAKDTIKPALSSIQGVGSVSLSGGRERTALVELDPSKMNAYGVSVAQVTSLLPQENITVPVGSMSQGTEDTSVRSVAKLTNIDDLANLVVAGKPSSSSSSTSTSGSATDVNRLVRLKDIAKVTDGYKEQTQIMRVNGQSAIGFSIVKTADANTLTVADDVKAEIKRLEKILPPGVHLNVSVDTSTYTSESVSSAEEDLILAVLITGFVLLLFLHLWRSTIIVLLAIPTSLISTFLVMSASGFSINIITLMALSLAIGILVDDSIVVLENIVRHLNGGESPLIAAFNGRAEIGLAAVAITLVDVVTYVPVAFTSGIVGQFFRSYGITIAAAVLFSLMVSFTLTPMLASRWLEKERESSSLWGRFSHYWDTGFDKLAEFYGRIIHWSLSSNSHRLVVLAVAAAAIGIAVPMASIIGFEFYPSEDDNRLQVSISMPSGTSLEATDAVFKQAEQLIVDQVPEATTLLTKLGSSSGDVMSFGSGSSGANSGSIMVVLVDRNQRKRSVFKIIDDIRPALEKIPGARVSLSIASGMGGMGSGLQIQVLGTDIEKLTELTTKVAKVAATVPGAVDVQNLEIERSPEVQAVLNRRKVSEMGLSAAQIGSALRTAIAGSEIGVISFPEGDADITVRTAKINRENLDQIMQLPVGNLNGRTIDLSQVADIQSGEAPAVIRRLNREHYFTVSANIAQGSNSGQVGGRIVEAATKQIEFPSGYHIQLGGMSEQQTKAFGELFGALALSLVLIYMLLVALYESFTHPLAIMFSVPVAVVGALSALLLGHATINIISLLGFILLLGIVTKNGILLVDFTNILRKERGFSRFEALVQAGKMRLRPILMTTFAIVFAQTPLILRSSAGSEMRRPMALVVIGGALSSLLLTLVLVPTVYSYLDSFGEFLAKLFGKKAPAEEHAGALTPLPQSSAVAMDKPASSSKLPSGGVAANPRESMGG